MAPALISQHLSLSEDWPIHTEVRLETGLPFLISVGMTKTTYVSLFEYSKHPCEEVLKISSPQKWWACLLSSCPSLPISVSSLWHRQFGKQKALQLAKKYFFCLVGSNQADYSLHLSLPICHVETEGTTHRIPSFSAMEVLARSRLCIALERLLNRGPSDCAADPCLRRSAPAFLGTCPRWKSWCEYTVNCIMLDWDKTRRIMFNAHILGQSHLWSVQGSFAERPAALAWQLFKQSKFLKWTNSLCQPDKWLLLGLKVSLCLTWNSWVSC